MSTFQRTVGDVLRDWRQRRHISQMNLAHEVGVSPRHLSFLETGRSQPSRDMLLRLADGLGMPLRERNALLVAAGYAPVFPERGLADPALAAVRRAVDLVLSGHEPYPAIAVDRTWNLITANRPAQLFLQGVSPELLEPPVNVLRLCFHPDGLVAHIRNREVLLPQLIARLGHEITATADPRLEALRDELCAYPAMRALGTRRPPQPDIVLLFEVERDGHLLRLISTTTVFGTAADVTVDELTIESFFPVDDATCRALQALVEGSPGGSAEPEQRQSDINS